MVVRLLRAPLVSNTVSQCDGVTAQWLESEVQAIKKAKAAMKSALEKGGDNLRVTCRRWELR